MMITVNIIGTGNVAWHLMHAFAKAIPTAPLSPSISVQYIAGHTKQSLDAFETNNIPKGNIAQLPEASLTILAVKDDAIAAVSNQLTDKAGLIVHTSGSVPMDALAIHQHHGVFYPLQSFTKGLPVNLSTLPICIEAAQKKDAQLLHQIASCLTNTIVKVNSMQRKQLHLAAVFANNFSNHCMTVAQDICTKNELSFEIMHPLLKHTFESAMIKGPQEAQTGPARRNDKKIMAKHLQELKGTAYIDIYKSLTQSISEFYGKEL